MKSVLPILIIIPHGGYRIPEELSGYEIVSDFDLFMQADTCANDLFYFGNDVIAKIDTTISRLFIDLDRPYNALPPNKDGIIKKRTLYKKNVFKDNIFPDEIAISNILKRYYFPFHNAVKKIIDTGNIKLILECHTIMAVGPKISPDPGKARPIIQIENTIIKEKDEAKTCADSIAANLLENLKKTLSCEKNTVADRFIHKDKGSNGFILKKYGQGKIPMFRLSLSRSLFLNDKYFSYDYLRVDELRLKHLNKLLWTAIKKFFNKNF